VRVPHEVRATKGSRGKGGVSGRQEGKKRWRKGASENWGGNSIRAGHNFGGVRTNGVKQSRPRTLGGGGRRRYSGRETERKQRFPGRDTVKNERQGAQRGGSIKKKHEEERQLNGPCSRRIRDERKHARGMSHCVCETRRGGQRSGSRTEGLPIKEKISHEKNVPILRSTARIYRYGIYVKRTETRGNVTAIGWEKGQGTRKPVNSAAASKGVPTEWGAGGIVQRTFRNPS